METSKSAHHAACHSGAQALFPNLPESCATVEVANPVAIASPSRLSSDALSSKRKTLIQLQYKVRNTKTVCCVYPV